MANAAEVKQEHVLCLPSVGREDSRNWSLPAGMKAKGPIQLI
jgi:hypothetical protein